MGYIFKSVNNKRFVSNLILKLPANLNTLTQSYSNISNSKFNAFNNTLQIHSRDFGSDSKIPQSHS